jgi:hypothetical protein
MRADTDELDLALRRRVDDMLSAGLVEELEAFAAKVSGGGGTESDARGVAQSIGFHEWGRYLRARGLHWTERRCEACDKTLRGETEWRAHVEGKRHRNRVAALRKKREGKHGTRQRESPT